MASKKRGGAVSTMSRENRAHGGGWRQPLINTSRRVFWLMFLINALNYLDRLIIVAVGPTLKSEFHLKDSQIGLLSSAFLLVYTLSALPLGMLADWSFPRAKIVAVGVAFWSVISGASAFAGNFASLFITRALVGVGEASYFPAGTALLSAYYGLEKRARILGRWQVGQLLGVALAYALSAALFVWLPSHLAWRVAFLVAGLPGLGLAIAMWFVAEWPATPVDKPPRAARPSIDEAPASEWSSGGLANLRNHLARVLRIRTVWAVVILQALAFIVITPCIAFLTIYLRSPRGPFHLGASGAAITSGLIVVGGATGAALGGTLADRLGARYTGGRVLAVGVSFALAAPFLLLLLITHSLSVFLLTGIIAVFALNLQSGPLAAMLQDTTPAAMRGTAVAVANLLAHLLGDVWAPGVVGAISTALHEREAIALLIVCLPALLVGAFVALPAAQAYARDLNDLGAAPNI